VSSKIILGRSKLYPDRGPSIMDVLDFVDFISPVITMCVKLTNPVFIPRVRIQSSVIHIDTDPESIFGSGSNHR
jgi:hypothetical protein